MKKFLSSYPELLKESHPTKNGDLQLENFPHRSDKKIWWKCTKGNDHIWLARIADRTGKKDRKRGCPFCAGKKVSKENSFKRNFPNIAKEWHPKKNGIFKPEDFTHGSGKKVWWQCFKIKRHEWQATIGDRTFKSTKCPYCAGKKVSKENNLATLFPLIAKEWHPLKNGKFTPKDFTWGSQKKVWWLCPKGHEYFSSIVTRSSRNTGCNVCTHKTSEPEIRLFTELKYIFNDVSPRHLIDNVEVDVFMPSLEVAIEYDGSYWHRNKEKRDLSKTKFLNSKGISVYRLREKPLKSLSKKDIIVNSRELKKSEFDKLLKKLSIVSSIKEKKKISMYLKKNNYQNEKIFKKYMSYFPSPFPEDSLLHTHSKLCKEWHYEKNFPLRPENFTHGSNKLLWWVCAKGHSYQKKIIQRADWNYGCPFCSGNAVGDDNNFKFLYPKIAKEWHPNKNGKFKPENYTAGSKKKFWWQCSKNDSHEWLATIQTRCLRKQGCPYCSKRLASKNYNLAIQFPLIAKEWHPKKNGKLRPENLSYGSKKKIWWQCSKDDGHEWKAAIYSRTSKQKSGCPFCWNKRRRKNK